MEEKVIVSEKKDETMDIPVINGIEIRSSADMAEALKLEGLTEDTILIDGFEQAVVGFTDDCHVIYSYDRMIDILMRRDGMDENEASEYIDFNTLGALEGMTGNKPIIMYPVKYTKIKD